MFKVRLWTLQQQTMGQRWLQEKGETSLQRLLRIHNNNNINNNQSLRRNLRDHPN